MDRTKVLSVETEDDDVDFMHSPARSSRSSQASPRASDLESSRLIDVSTPIHVEGTSPRFVKLTILASVTIQNTMYALARRYSRGSLKETYSTSSVLLAMELAKMFVSIVQIKVSGDPTDVPEGTLPSKLVYLLSYSLTMAVPAIIYLVMNLLGFVALGHLDAATFSIIAQMKVLTTALFSVLLLHRSLAPRKWRALATLCLGVVLISNEAVPKPLASGSGDTRMMNDYFVGMAASFGDVLLSGFVSIYFEMVLKSKAETYSVWDRNFQLSFWSAMMYAPIMLYDNAANPFVGWSVATVGCAFIGALGGILVALSIKHTDSIMKTIATTGSIVLTTVLNAGFLGGPMTLEIWTGALIVICSVFSYNDQGDPWPTNV